MSYRFRWFQILNSIVAFRDLGVFLRRSSVRLGVDLIRVTSQERTLETTWSRR